MSSKRLEMKPTSKATIALALAEFAPDWEVHTFNGAKDVSYTHRTCGTVVQSSSVKADLHRLRTMGRKKVCPTCKDVPARGKYDLPLRKMFLERLKQHRPHDHHEYKLIGDYKGFDKIHQFKHACGVKFKVMATSLITENASCPCKRIGSWKTITIKGRKFVVQGNEDLALRWLVKKGVEVDSILTHSGNGRDVPTFKYTYKGKEHTYIPDFRIAGTNKIIEVKDPSSLGLHARKSSWFRGQFNRNRAKARAVEEAGYSFKLLVFVRGRGKIKLPKDWYHKPRVELERRIRA